MGELDDEGGKQLDHDVRHLHRAHGESHHTLFGTAVDEAGLKALHQLPLCGTKAANQRYSSS